MELHSFEVPINSNIFEFCDLSVVDFEYYSNTHKFGYSYENPNKFRDYSFKFDYSIITMIARLKPMTQNGFRVTKLAYYFTS